MIRQIYENPYSLVRWYAARMLLSTRTQSGLSVIFTRFLFFTFASLVLFWLCFSIIYAPSNSHCCQSAAFVWLQVYWPEVQTMRQQIDAKLDIQLTRKHTLNIDDLF